RPQIQENARNQRSNQKNRDCNRPASTLLLSNHWSRRSARLAKLLWHFGIPVVFGVEIYHRQPHPMFDFAFAQIMQVALPMTVLFQVLGHVLGHQDVTGIATVHHALSDVSPGSSYVGATTYVNHTA